MMNILGTRIIECRESLGLTQDKFGAKYGVSGPAIFKFERGYAKPSLGLWLRIARDMRLGERRAVRLWAKAKLPEKFQKFIDLDGALTDEEAAPGPIACGIDYSKYENRDEMRKIALGDESLPIGLRALLKDPDVWNDFKLRGDELNRLRDSVAMLGQGSPGDYREALRLVRRFTQQTF